MCREYYLHTRKSGIFYVEFINPENGKKLPARSTGETVKLKAQLKAEQWLVDGIPTGRTRKSRSLEEIAGIDGILRSIRRADLTPDDAMRIVETLKSTGLIDITAVKNTGRGAVPFVQFLETFWDFEKSDYIRDQLAHGFRFTKRYASGCQGKVSKYMKPFFGDKKLNCVTTDDLEKLTIQLTERGLATSTKNQILLICRTPLKWACKKKIISSDPGVGLTRFAVTNKERGIFTEAEATAIFSIDWKDKRAFVASLVAVTTGAREGECLALRRSDIGTDTLNIAHNFAYLDGLKCPKNGEKRVAPLLPEVRAALLDLLKDNPHDTDDPFVFFSLLPDRPVDPKVVLKGLKKAIETVNENYKKAAEQAKLEKPEIFIDYKARNIVFHSWRHWFCSKMTEVMEGEKIAKVSGHISEAVFKKYADHIEKKNIKEVGDAAAQAFANILQFRKAS